MKKVTVHQFDPESLKTGSVMTKKSKPHLQTKRGGGSHRKVPNLGKNLERHTYEYKTGDQLVAAMLKDMT